MLDCSPEKAQTYSPALSLWHDIDLMEMEYFSSILVGAFVLNRDIATRNGENSGPGFINSRITIVTAGDIITPACLTIATKGAVFLMSAVFLISTALLIRRHVCYIIMVPFVELGLKIRQRIHHIHHVFHLLR